MGNKQTGYFVYNSAVEGPDFNYHQDYNQGPYNHEGKYIIDNLDITTTRAKFSSHFSNFEMNLY